MVDCKPVCTDSKCRLLLFIVVAIVLCVLSLFDSVLPLW